MHLKTLTVRGFKSFASATTFNLEPGVTCIVGPNGSGKSNVVDAISWVMGEQGAKSLRGGKMEDVIFAGAGGRAPLGRAEVELTIDNTDGALDIDFTEVTIRRTMFRSGGSEYAINGEPCRLLDVQELLSDSGIGREMHVIVGQGRLDSILHASPEDRRGFIEEAAGVLKHRKRKEKALRKLAAMEANLTRLTDLTAELRRQLKPLGRQAEVARRADVIQSDVRDARLRLMADDLHTYTAALHAEEADEAALLARRTIVEDALAELSKREAELESAAETGAPHVREIQSARLRLVSLVERFHGLLALAQERAAHLAEPIEFAAGPDPEELLAQAEQVDAEAESVAAAIQESRAQVEETVADHARLRAVLLAERSRIADAERAAAEHREMLARAEGEVTAAEATVAARVEELERVRAQRAEAESVLSEAIAAAEDATRSSDAGTALAAAQQTLDAARSAEGAAEVDLGRATERVQAASTAAAALVARIEALELSRKGRDGAAALLADETVEGIIGPASALMHVEPGWEPAIAAALGHAADAIAVREQGVVDAAAHVLVAEAAGQATFLVAGTSAPARDDLASTLASALASTPGVRPAADVVRVDPRIQGSVGQILDGIVVADDLAAAARITERNPAVLAVTKDGEIIAATFRRAGARDAQSPVEIQAAIEETRAEIARLEVERADAEQESDRARATLAQARESREQAQRDLAQAQSVVAAAEQAEDGLRRARGDAADRAERASGDVEAAEAALAEAHRALDERIATLTSAQARPLIDVPDEGSLEALQGEVDAVNSTAMAMRLSLATAEERHRTLTDRAAGLRDAAEAEVRGRQERVELVAARARQAETAAQVAAAAGLALRHVERYVASATATEEHLVAEATAREAEQREVRAELRRLGAEMEELTSSVHRDEIARAEQRLRIEALVGRAMEEYGVEADVLLAEYGPNVLVPPSPPAPGDEVDPDAEPARPYPFVRAEQEARLAEAEKGLALLGRVNPLALEEFSAMEERHTFLTAQLEDLRKGRDDLLGIIRDVDDRVQQVFAEAFADTAREFEGVFGRLFPGGEGRLVLTDPSDLLTTGIEVEARPPGKKIKRLSLLSGGERSLTAVAFLVALFKARPSPFYILDEVEAALDDVNLGRLIGLLSELRDSSQLLVITHQKRTMEIADALYGVTMRGGVTQVISQRLHEVEPVG